LGQVMGQVTFSALLSAPIRLCLLLSQILFVSFS